MWLIVEQAVVSVGQAVVWVFEVKDFAFGDTLSLSNTSIHSNTGKKVLCNAGEFHRTGGMYKLEVLEVVGEEEEEAGVGNYIYRWFRLVHKHSVLPDIHRGSHFLKC